MNSLKLLFFLLPFLPIQFVQQTDYAILQGEVQNYRGDGLVLRNNFWEPIDTIQLVNGQFRDTLKLPDSYYYLSIGEETMYLYLEAGMDLNLTVNASDIDNTASWQGVGQEPNNYLLSKDRLTNSIPLEQRIYNEYGLLGEADFLAQTKSIYQAYLGHFEQAKGLSPEFSFLEENSIKIANAIRIEQFEGIKRLVTNDESFEVSENYPDPFAGLDLNNALLMRTYEYEQIMQYYVSSLITDRSGSVDFFVLFQQELGKSDLKPEIRDRLGLKNSEYGFTYTKDQERYYREYMSFVSIPEYRDDFQRRYNEIRMEKGKPSPGFQLEGLDNKQYTLDDFKGKYLYIDLWASWCTPCIAQIPHLKKLEDKYKDKITFISIAWNDRKANWKNAIEKYDLSGIQLFAPDKNTDFFTFYNVSAIPRFILLDKEGNIIESMARQPSEDRLDEQLGSLE